MFMLSFAAADNWWWTRTLAIELNCIISSWCKRQQYRSYWTHSFDLLSTTHKWKLHCSTAVEESYSPLSLSCKIYSGGCGQNFLAYYILSHEDVSYRFYRGVRCILLVGGERQTFHLGMADSNVIYWRHCEDKLSSSMLLIWEDYITSFFSVLWRWLRGVGWEIENEKHVFGSC